MKRRPLRDTAWGAFAGVGNSGFNHRTVHQEIVWLSCADVHTPLGV